MRRCFLAVLLMAAVIGPRAGEAQEAEATAVLAGAAGGVVSGAIVTIGWVVERATIEQKYLHEVEDIVSVVGTPLLVFPAAGMGLALLDRGLLKEVGAGAAMGTVGGAALGIGLGHIFAGGETGRWAGGLMGAAAGLLAGAVIAGVDGVRDLRSDPAAASTASVPVGVTFRF